MPYNALKIRATDGRWHVNATIGEKRADGFSKEIGVFEEDEQAEVEDKGQNHERLSQSALPYSTNGSCDEVVGGGDECQKPEEETTGLVVEIVGKKGDEQDSERISLSQTIVDERES